MKKSSKRSKPRTYTYEFRLQCVRLCEEESYPRNYVSEQGNVSVKTLANWIKRYRDNGEDGLKDKPRGKRGRAQVHSEVKEKIIEIKKEYPIFGSKRISDVLKRIFFLKASPETVRQTLQKEDLVQPPKRKPRKNPQKPRFFERSTPNQMWQTDIFSFRLGGQSAYLLGYIDDYSRYIVGLGLYRKQTAENLLEVYRQAIGETGCPAEMLTDNGRQYTNWRGVTRFEKEMKKDRIKHIKSQPHHPMTLGKIERFWKTIWTEFLDRCQFDSMETARERIALWVKYYNHRRPHQGIGGLCPADRYFEIASDLRNVMEKNIEENILEQALRGRSTKPFYMVGRMNGQSVVLQAEKGKVSFSVEGEEKQNQLFEMEKENVIEEKTQPEELHFRAEGTGSVITVDGTVNTDGTVRFSGNKLSDTEKVAGTLNGGYVESTGITKLKTANEIVESKIGESSQRADPEETIIMHGEATIRDAAKCLIEEEDNYARRATNHDDNNESSFRVNDRRVCRKGDGSIAQDLLRVRKQGAHCNVTVVGAGATGETAQGCGSGEGAAEKPGEGPADSTDIERTGYSDPQTSVRRDPRRRLF